MVACTCEQSLLLEYHTTKALRSEKDEMMKLSKSSTKLQRQLTHRCTGLCGSNTFLQSNRTDHPAHTLRMANGMIGTFEPFSLQTVSVQFTDYCKISDTL